MVSIQSMVVPYSLAILGFQKIWSNGKAIGCALIPYLSHVATQQSNLYQVLFLFLLIILIHLPDALLKISNKSRESKAHIFSSRFATAFNYNVFYNIFNPHQHIYFMWKFFYQFVRCGVVGPFFLVSENQLKNLYFKIKGNFAWEGCQVIIIKV